MSYEQKYEWNPVQTMRPTIIYLYTQCSVKTCSLFKDMNILSIYAVVTVLFMQIF